MERTDESYCMQSDIPLNPLMMKKTQKLKKKLENLTKNSRGKLKKPAFFETPDARKALKKET